MTLCNIFFVSYFQFLITCSTRVGYLWSKYSIFLFFYCGLAYASMHLTPPQTARMKSCLVLVESQWILSELDTALHATGIWEQLLFLCNTDWACFTIQPSDNSAMFIHVETRCFPLRTKTLKPVQSNKPGCFSEGLDMFSLWTGLKRAIFLLWIEEIY